MDSPAVARILAVAFCLALMLCWGVTAAGERAFGGVGLQVVPVAGGELVVLQIVPSSPAASSGLLPGDLLVEIDGFALAGSDFAEVVPRHLWGEVGSAVTLRYLRPGREGVREVSLRRVQLQAPAEQPTGVHLLTPDE